MIEPVRTWQTSPTTPSVPLCPGPADPEPPRSAATLPEAKSPFTTTRRQVTTSARCHTEDATPGRASAQGPVPALSSVLATLLATLTAGLSQSMAISGTEYSKGGTASLRDPTGNRGQRRIAQLYSALAAGGRNVVLERSFHDGEVIACTKEGVTLKTLPSDLRPAGTSGGRHRRRGKVCG